MLIHQCLSNPRKNQLLCGLPEDVLQRFCPSLELVHLKLGDVVYECGEKPPHAYFPTTTIVSLLHVLENGDSAEIAVTGNDGMLGVGLFMGGETLQNRAVVQSEGYSYRCKAQVLKNEFSRCGTLEKQLLRYAQSLLTQMSQTAICNRHHTIEQQLCRWILLSLDLLASNELQMTQELIANMLGVRRESVTSAAGKLQRRGLIQYGRGHIRVLDRQGLEEASCECYQVVRHESRRLLECKVAS